MSFFENISPLVSKYVLWEEPVKSGAVLGGATFVYVVVENMKYNIINLSADLALVSLLFLALWTQVSAFMPNRAPPTNPPKLQVTEAQLRVFAENTVLVLNSSLENLYKIGVSKDKVLVLKFLFLFKLISVVGSLFHLLTVAYIALLVSFLWPPLYKKYKKEVDHACGEAKKQFDLHYDKMKERVQGKVAEKKEK